MKTTEKKSFYTIINGEIEKIQYNEWIYENGMDETTTPHGVAPRVHIRCMDCKGTYSLYGCGCENKNYILYSWGVGGNNLKIYDDNFGNGYTLKGAENELFKVFTKNATEDDQSAPLFETFEEAKDAYL